MVTWVFPLWLASTRLKSNESHFDRALIHSIATSITARLVQFQFDCFCFWIFFWIKDCHFFSIRALQALWWSFQWAVFTKKSCSIKSMNKKSSAQIASVRVIVSFFNLSRRNFLFAIQKNQSTQRNATANLFSYTDHEKTRTRNGRNENEDQMNEWNVL